MAAPHQLEYFRAPLFYLSAPGVPLIRIFPLLPLHAFLVLFTSLPRGQPCRCRKDLNFSWHRWAIVSQVGAVGNIRMPQLSV